MDLMGLYVFFEEWDQLHIFWAQIIYIYTIDFFFFLNEGVMIPSNSLLVLLPIKWCSTKLKFKVGWEYWNPKLKNIQYFIWGYSKQVIFFLNYLYKIIFFYIFLKNDEHPHLVVARQWWCDNICKATCMTNS